MKSKQFRTKIIVIVELIACYMSLLTVISHQLAPVEYRNADSEPILTTTDFISFLGERAGDQLTFLGDGAGTAVGYEAAVQLAKTERFNVSFSLKVEESDEGKSLFADLYNGDRDYDRPKQEKLLILQKGECRVDFPLLVGENAPETAKIRLFTLDAASWSVSDVEVYEAVPIQKVTPVMLCVVAVIWGSTLVTVVYVTRKKKN